MPSPARVGTLSRKVNAFNRKNQGSCRLVFVRDCGILGVEFEGSSDFGFIMYSKTRKGVHEKFINALCRKCIYEASLTVVYEGWGETTHVVIAINSVKFKFGLSKSSDRCWSIYGPCRQVNVPVNAHCIYQLNRTMPNDYQGKIVGNRLYYGRWSRFHLIGHGDEAVDLRFNTRPKMIKSVPFTFDVPRLLHPSVSSVCIPENVHLSDCGHIVLTLPRLFWYSGANETVTITYSDELTFAALVYHEGSDQPIELLDADNKTIARYAVVIINNGYCMMNDREDFSILEEQYGAHYNMYGPLVDILSDETYYNERGELYNGEIIYVDVNDVCMMAFDYEDGHGVGFKRIYRDNKGLRTKAALRLEEEPL